MSFVLQAPYPNLSTSVILPSPRLGNTQNNTADVQTIRTMNGTLYTYIKAKRGRKKFQWDFLTSKDKGLELKEFIKLFAGGKIKVIDHKNTVIIGYITINPLDQAGEGRGWGKNEEAVSYRIEMEEVV